MARKSTVGQNPPTDVQTKEYELLYPLLKSILFEVKELSKKKQDETMNKLKVRMINKLLTRIKNNVLNDDPSKEFLDLLDEETLPTNSDAVLIIAQFETAMMQFNNEHYGWDGPTRRWFTKEHPGFKK
jgi:ribosome-binding ATPase YchF (GTP1/OBG family)